MLKLLNRRLARQRHLLETSANLQLPWEKWRHAVCKVAKSPLWESRAVARVLPGGERRSGQRLPCGKGRFGQNHFSLPLCQSSASQHRPYGPRRLHHPLQQFVCEGILCALLATVNGSPSSYGHFRGLSTSSTVLAPRLRSDSARQSAILVGAYRLPEQLIKVNSRS